MNADGPSHGGVGRESRTCLAHLVFGLFHGSTFFGGENIVWVGRRALRFDEHAILCSVNATKSLLGV